MDNTISTTKQNDKRKMPLKKGKSSPLFSLSTKEEQLKFLHYNETIEQNIVMYHNGVSARSPGCVQMESATYLARVLLEEYDDERLYVKLTEKSSTQGFYGSADESKINSRFSKHVTSMLQEKFNSYTAYYVNRFNRDKRLVVDPIPFEKFREQLSTWVAAVTKLKRKNHGKIPSHDLLKKVFGEVGLRPIMKSSKRWDDQSDNQYSAQDPRMPAIESSAPRRSNRLSTGKRSSSNDKTITDNSDQLQPENPIEELAEAFQEEEDAQVEQNLDKAKIIRSLRYAKKNKRKRDDSVRIADKAKRGKTKPKKNPGYACLPKEKITLSSSDKTSDDEGGDPIPEIPLFSEFESGIDPKWKATLVMAIVIEDWEDTSQQSNEAVSSDFWNLLTDIADRHKHEFKLPSGNIATVYDHEQIVKELSQRGYDKSNLPKKMTFVCTSISFSYTFAGARYRPHGIASLNHSKLLEQVCIAMNISVHWIRGNSTELPLERSNLPQTYLNQESDEFQQLFGGLRLDPRALYSLLEQKMQVDELRKVSIWNGGYSTQDHKRTEDWMNANEPCSTPKLCSEKDKEVYMQLGSIADCIQDYFDKHCMVDGCPPFNDPIRFDLFGKRLREKMRASRWRVDAINVSFENFGTVEEIAAKASKGELCEVRGGRRHLDKKDETDPALQHTCVFSTYYTHLGFVWRMSIIAFGRCCLTSSSERVRTRQLYGEKLSTYKTVFNGGIDYRDFFLDHELAYYITQDGYKKLRKGDIGATTEIVEKLCWLEDKEKYPGFFYVQVAEFMSRCGYSSAFASSIVQLSTKHRLPRKKVVELILIALKGCGCRNFCYILTIVWRDRSRNELMETCLQHLYWTDCKRHNLSVNGGDNPRIQAGKDTMVGVVPEEALRDERSDTLPMFPFLNNEEREHYVARSEEQVKLVESVIDYIEDENIEIKDLGTIHKYLGQLPEVSDQRLRSFFMLLVFTGIAKSEAALQFSVKAKVEWNGKYGQHLQTNGIESQKAFTNLCNDLFHKFSWEEQVVENGLCGDERETKRKDEFHYGQIMFDLKQERNDKNIIHVLQKEFGSTYWGPICKCYVDDDE